MEKLPFEINRKVFVKKEVEIDANLGKYPKDRSVEELLSYGIVNINKSAGPTSHQIVDFVKSSLEIKKAGHSGTLDPGVTGVLPIALEKATRITNVLLKAGKEYVGLMYLHKDVDEERLNEVIKEFVGEVEQLPPLRSAVKREKRKRNVYYFKILEKEGRNVLFKVGCEAGTYIRRICLEPDMEILTSEGIRTIKELCDHKNKVSVFSYRDGKIKQNRILDFQKVPFSKDLIEITTTSGIPIKVTPDHKLLVSTKEGPIMKKAEEMNEGDFLFRSIDFPMPTKKRFIAELLDEEYLVHDDKIKEKCKIALIKKFGSIRELYRKTKIDRKPFNKNSKIDIKIKHLKIAGIFEQLKSELNCFKTEKGKIVKVNPKFTKELLYLIGLVSSDGNNTREKNTLRHTRIKFYNKDINLINQFYDTVKVVFPGIKVTKKFIKDIIWQVETSNSLFATICANFGISSPSIKYDILPILGLDNELVASFLRGYFDGDGNAYFKIKERIKGSYSHIRFFSIDFVNIKRIHQMLLKLGIQNKIFKVKVDHLRFNSKNKLAYVITLSDPASKFKFSKVIGSKHSRKKAILKEIRKYFEKLKTKPSDYLYCSLDKKNNLKEGRYNKFGGNWYRLLKNEIPMTNYIYNKLVSLNKNISSVSEEFTIERIRFIKKIPFKGFVYDITVERDHNFLIENGIVSSNCDDIGKKLGTGAHMKSLIRTKVAGFTDENWCSLQDLSDAFVLYKGGNEREIRKLIFNVEKAVEFLPKIWVVDSAVDSICHGANLNVPGISKLNEFNEKEITALMTLKDELIGLGETRMNSKDVLEKEKGMAVKTSKVFMERKVYKS